MKNASSRSGFYLSLIVVFLLSSCQKGTERKVSSAFYHWKTNLDISAFEESYLTALSANRLYLRVFDVDWDGNSNQPSPVASIEIKSAIPEAIEIVPTVFITNRTFLNIHPEDIPQLAENVSDKIFLLLSDFPSHQVKELQFDCDWSPKTQAKFFEFLKQIRLKTQEKSILLSSTIRLHQVKFFEKTGVPPVDRGVLMFYNMGNVEDLDAKNSILDLTIAKQYLGNLQKYPLPLDLALPLFSWGVLIREGRMTGLINNLRASDLMDESRFSKIDETHFELVKSTYLQGYYLYKGDVLRLETAPAELLQEAADLLSKSVADADLTVIFYHLDSIALNSFSYETLEDICNRFR